ncbi:MAG: UvrD-helicase domain-containing protein [Firmicutes bacterium]|nr:UvrD-helicase domain-containing protein [Bacillota bacterium]
MILDGLNPQQKEAAAYLGGPVLVLAGAGSGKTRVLTHRFAYLVSKGVDPGRILAITFTNKAAGEMKARVRGLLGDLGRDIWVSTFHSACVRILRRDYDKIGGQRNFTILDTDDQLTAVKACLKELNLNDKKYSPTAVLATISRAKNNVEGPQAMAAGARGFFEERVAEVYRRYQKKLRDNNALDFDDLLLETLRLFRERPDVLEFYRIKFQHILVDEYQDTNRAQYELVRVLAGDQRNVFVVGDDDQGIYKFRGADIRNILEFERDYPDAKVVKLEQNYRSTQNILDAAWNIIRNNMSRKEKRLWTENGQGQRMIYYRAPDQHGEATFVTEEIARLRKLFGLPYSSFAVLYRTHAQSRAFEEVFMTSNVPYNLVGGLRFYERREIKDVMAYLKLLRNPHDSISLSRAAGVPKRGLGESTMDKIMAYARREGISPLDAMGRADQIEGVRGAGAKAATGFHALMTAFAEHTGLFRLVEDVLERTGYLAALEVEGTIEAMTRVENLKELLNVAREFEIANPENTLDLFLESVSLMSDVDTYEEGKDSVALMTLHTAKGLEFPVVFLSGMEEGLFPHSRSIGDQDELEEERRLCYVGMTRAKELLYLTGARDRMMYGEYMPSIESRFLKEIPAALYVRAGD